MKAYELIADPKNWIKGENACDVNGDKVLFMDDACLSSAAAISRVYGGWNNPPHQKLFEHVTQLGYDGIVAWNDAPDRTHAEVIAVLKELDL